MTSTGRHTPQESSSQRGSQQDELKSTLETPRSYNPTLEDRFHGLLEAIPSAMLIVDRAGRILLINSQTEKSFGYTREEILGQSVEKFVPERFRGKHPVHRAHFFSNPLVRPMGMGRDLYGLRKDGSEFPVEIGLNPIETENGLVILASIVDITERKRAEERFRLVVEAAPNSIVMADGAGKIILVNAQTEKLFGYRREELIGQNIETLVPERFRQRHPDHRVIFINHPSVRPMGAGRDLFGLRKDGSEFPVEIGLNPIETEQGLTVLASIVDITERKQVEEQNRFQARLLAGVTDAIIATDLQLNILSWNTGAETMYGWMAQKVIDRPVQEIIPDFLGTGLKTESNELPQRSYWRGELMHQRRDGTKIVVLSSIALYKDTEGKPAGYVALNRDITERKQVEEQNRFLANLVASVSDAIIATDMQLNIQSWNTGAEAMYGWQAEEAIGQPASEVLKTDFLNQSRQAVTKQVMEQGSWSGEVVQECRDGTKIPALSSVSLYKDAEGKPAGVVAVNRDITERKRAEEALLESENHARSLLNLSRQLERAQTYSEALAAALEQVRTVLGYQNVWTYLLSQDRQHLRLLTATGEKFQMVTDDFPTLKIAGDRFLEEIAEGRDIVVVEDARTDPRTNKDIVAQLGNRTIVNVPIILMERHLGAFGTGSFGDEGVKVPTPTQLDYLRALASHMAVTLDRIHLLAERRKAEERQYFLASVSKTLASSLDYETTLTAVAQLAVPKIADWCTVYLRNPEGSIELVTLTHANPEKVKWARELQKRFPPDPNAPRGVAQVIRSGQAEFLPQIPEERLEPLKKDSEIVRLLDELQLTGAMTIPLTLHSRTLGAISLISAESRHHYTFEDLELAEELARRIAVAVENARLYRSAQQLNQELEQRVVERTAQLRESEEKFSKAFLASPAAISIASVADGRYIEVNETLAKLTGYSREELIGHTSLELGLVDLEAREKILQSAREHGFIRDVEIQVHTKSNQIVDVLVSVEQIVLNGQECLLTIQYDITKRKRAEAEVRRLNQELEATNRELEAFSYSVSHDLRAPLRAINGFSQALSTKYTNSLGEQGLHYLNRIQVNTRHMGQLIDDLLSLSRISRREMKREQINLTELASEIIKELRAQDPRRQVLFEAEGQLEARGDAGLIRIVLQNLLSNAWKFTFTRPDGQAHIQFGTQPHPNLLSLHSSEFTGEDGAGQRVFFIRDNGVGFDMAYANKLFGAFQRLHTTEEFPGTGIGLATVKRIIHRHGGKVWAESEIEKGATFYFTLGE